MTWLGNDKNWFPENKPKPIKPKEENKKLTEPENEYSVFYVPLRCPNKKCRSKEIKCYNTAPPIRYHYCRECGLRFKSIEQ